MTDGTLKLAEIDTMEKIGTKVTQISNQTVFLKDILVAGDKTLVSLYQ